jgi:hypothetical protein
MATGTSTLARPIDLSSYLASASPPPPPQHDNAQQPIRAQTTRREDLEQTMMRAAQASAGAAPTKLKKQRSAWNLRTGGKESNETTGVNTNTPATNGWGGFVNRLRSRSSHNLKADVAKDAAATRSRKPMPPLPVSGTKRYQSATVPSKGTHSAVEGATSRPGTSQEVYGPGHPQRVSLGDDLVHPNDRSRAGSAAPSAMTYTSASSSSTSGWSSRFPTPAATPMTSEGDVRVEVDPFDLTSPTTDIFNFTELGFLRGSDGRHVYEEETAGGGRYSVFGFGGSAESKSIGKRPSTKRLGSARSLRDLRAAAGGLFGGADLASAGGADKREHHQLERGLPSAPPSATLRYRRSAAKLGGGAGDREDEHKTVQKRSSMSWLRGTFGRKETSVAGQEDGAKRTIVERPSIEDAGNASPKQDRVTTPPAMTVVAPEQVLQTPVQRNKVRPALTITLPSSNSLGGPRPAIPLSLSDEHVSPAATGDKGKAQSPEQDEAVSATTSLPASTGSFSDLYAELGIMPPGESDEEMPYSPRVERPIDAFSFGDILASLGGTRPIEVATPDKTNSVVIGKGSTGTSIVSSGRETKRSSWRSSRHSIKPASAPPTADLPPLPTLVHLQAGEQSNETEHDAPLLSSPRTGPQEQPLSPRSVDLSSGITSAVELGFEPIQHIRSWDEIRAVAPDAMRISDGSDSADVTLITETETDLDASMDYGILDTYHDAVDMTGAVGHMTCSAGGSGIAPSGSGSTQQPSNGADEAVGYSPTQIVPRGRESAEPRRRGGPSRSRSSSRSPRRVPARAGSPASQDGTDDESDGSDGSDSDDAGESGSDDDVPLAQRIPGALRAQRTLRRGAKRNPNSAATPRKDKRRPRIDGRDNPNWQGEGGVPARALEQKLLALSDSRNTSSPDTFVPHQYRSTSVRVPRPPAPSHQTSSRQVTQPVVQSGTQSDLSRHASVNRSASRMRHHRSVENSPVLESAGFTPVSYASSRSQTPGIPPVPVPRLHKALPSGHQHIEVDSSGKEWLASRSPSLRKPDGRLRSGSTSEHLPSSGTSSNMVSRKPSLAGERVPSRKPSGTHPSMPTSPLVDSHIAAQPSLSGASRQRQASGDRTAIPALSEQVVVTRQAVYLESMQGERKMVDLKPTTTAAEVLAQILGSTASQGFMGDWILFEVFGEYFNMERPVRSFESLVTIMKGWNADFRKNTFLAKRSPLDRLTRVEVSCDRIPGKNTRSANSHGLSQMMPRVQPMHGVYVQHETKRGKWSKRWIELRNGNVFVAKNDRVSQSPTWRPRFPDEVVNRSTCTGQGERLFVQLYSV